MLYVYNSDSCAGNLAFPVFLSPAASVGFVIQDTIPNALLRQGCAFFT